MVVWMSSEWVCGAFTVAFSTETSMTIGVLGESMLCECDRDMRRESMASTLFWRGGRPSTRSTSVTCWSSSKWCDSCSEPSEMKESMLLGWKSPINISDETIARGTNKGCLRWLMNDKMPTFGQLKQGLKVWVRSNYLCCSSLKAIRIPRV